MAEPQTPPRFCSDLLGLYFIHPECKEEQIVYAFSFDRRILEQMIIDNFKEEVLERVVYKDVDGHYKKNKVLKVEVISSLGYENETIETNNQKQ